MTLQLKQHLGKFRHHAELVHRGMNPDIAFSLAFENWIDTKLIRNRMAVINEDVEADLRSFLHSLPLTMLTEESSWNTKRFETHRYGHKYLVSIQKKEDWYFEFADRPEFDSTWFSLSELPLESKLILIDLLQKS